MVYLHDLSDMVPFSLGKGVKSSNVSYNLPKSCIPNGTR